MKKLTFKLSILALVFISLNSKAQIQLSANDFYSKGTFKMSTDTGQNVNLGAPGTNIIWDFSKLQSHLPFSIQISPYLNSFVDANLVEIENTDTVGIIKKTNSQISFVIFEKNLRLLNCPLNYLNKITDSVMHYIAFSGEQFGYPLLDSVRINTTFLSTVFCDAWGKIKLPIGTFDALRLKITISVFSYHEGKNGNAAYSRISNNKEEETSISYTWYTKNKGYYLASYDDQDLEMRFMLSSVLSSKNMIALSTSKLQISNPITNQILLINKNTENFSFKLIDLMGKDCLKGNIHGYETLSLDASNIPSGYYTLQMVNLNNHAVSFQKIVK